MKTILLIATLFCVNFYIFSQEDDFVTDVKYIQEIVVKSSSTQTALDLYSQNILDYRVYGKDILTLKKRKRDYYIGIEYVNKEAENYQLEIDRPRSIYIDCMNNVFILNDYNAYQFVIKDSIQVISVLNLGIFYANVKSCVGNFDSTLLVQRYTNYNKGYQLNMYNKETKKKEVVFSMIDSVALNNYFDIINPNKRLRIVQNSQMHRNQRRPNSNQNLGDRYNQRGANDVKTPVGYNDVYYSTNRRMVNSFNNRVSVNPSAQQMKSLTSHYQFNDAYFKSLASSRNVFYSMVLKNLYNTKIEIKTFQLNNEEFMVVDRFKSMVSIFQKDGVLLTQMNFNFESVIIEMIQDPYTREVYFTSKTENLFKVHRLNIEDGTTHYVGGFKNIMLARTIKIFDGWIYYRVKKNDYYKLYRTRLRS